MSRSSLIAIALLVLACGGQPYQRYQDPGERALVYVYSPSAGFGPSGFALFQLEVEGNPMFWLRDSRFFPLYLKPGETEFSGTYTRYGSSHSSSITAYLRPGSISYLKAQVESGLRLEGRPAFTFLEAEMALPELQRCTLLE